MTMIQNDSLIVHVGLPKTGSTTLQRHVFPAIATIKNITFNPESLQKLLGKIHLLPDETGAQLAQVKAELAKGSLLISNEALVGFHPDGWEAFADRNLEIFGKDATIILSIRDGEALMKSWFLEMFKQGVQSSPVHFFLKKDVFVRFKAFRASGLPTHFSVDDFDMRRLYALYATRFEKVYLLPLETLSEGKVLQDVFALNADQTTTLRAQMKAAKRENVAYSARGVQLVLLKEKIVRIFGLTGFNVMPLDQILDDLDPEKSKILAETQRFDRLKFSSLSCQNKRKAFARKLRRKIGYWISIRFFIERILDTYFPYKPYQLPDGIYRNEELNAKNRQFCADVIREQRESATGYVPPGVLLPQGKTANHEPAI